MNLWNKKNHKETQIILDFLSRPKKYLPFLSFQFYQQDISSNNKNA
jgi:hypothetical protein